MNIDQDNLHPMQSNLAFFVDAIRNPSSLGAYPFDSDGSLELASEHQIFKIRIARTSHHRKSASLLIDRMYSWRGYECGEVLGDDPNKITLVAYSSDEAVGTLSIGLDSPTGLFADEMYHDELNALRAQGCKICEFRGFAVDAGIKSRRIIASLFHIAYFYPFRIFSGSDGVLEVNPRHVGFYEKKLGFTRLGPERICPRVNAPAVLMRSNFSYMAAQIQKWGGLLENAQDEKSLYPYFFSKTEENGIIARLIGIPE